MRDDDFPTPLSDPEADGLPDTADDDSSAYDDVATGRSADGPDPAPLPPDREDGTLELEHHGLTADEQLDGESLDYKLTRESAERAVNDPLAGPVDPGIAAEADSEEAAAQAQFDADVLDDGPTSDPESPVSLYDHGILGGDGTPVGRLVEQDQGGVTRGDTEPDSVAWDAGAAGGGGSAEERAVHETEPPEAH
ncbi:DUF5709 domain-containing protein [Plantactinospora sp. KBS50]|uniref:DUF5709 domain-containing protein n=1 Tax=Plantactinospora sp. KBS50 TaxID=2024580 RepID=UPI000BAADD99|nr:DUF5709 domain-containing protein [Plantactinospora sp. KBS50]ASW56589.1 hypothetical protein CIK06_24165 [Plantactinospora sp. KBS50]